MSTQFLRQISWFGAGLAHNVTIRGFSILAGNLNFSFIYLITTVLDFQSPTRFWSHKGLSNRKIRDNGKNSNKRTNRNTKKTN